MPKGIYERTKFKPAIDRLLAKTTKTDTCWLWGGSKSKFGHGEIMVFKDGKKRLVRTHRLSWEFFVGNIPEGFCVLHRCDVPNCINPDHLFIGTKADNSADMISKKRQKKGELLPQSKLTEKEVKEIRTSTDNQTYLAKIYGVNQSTIHNIIHRKQWVHVT